MPSRVAGLVPLGSLTEGRWNPEDHLSKSEQRQTATFTQYAIAAAAEALQDAQITSLSSPQRESTGVVIGSGIGNLEEQHATSVNFAQNGHHSTHPLYVPRTLINMAAGHIAMRYGFMGPNTAPSTACTTGLHAFIEGAQMIQNPNPANPVDIVVAGASEACVHPLSISGFARARSLSTAFNDTPEIASRPFDLQRDGFVIGEGAGVVVLEEYEHARKRGASIYAELAGMGMSCDANHMTAPRADGYAAQLAMQRALNEASHKLKEARHTSMRTDKIQESLSKVGYVNAHATSTAVGDAAENNAIKNVLIGEHDGGGGSSVSQPYRKSFHSLTPQNTRVSSTKGATGHLLGAAGAVEAIFTLLAMRDGILPPTINLDFPGEAASQRNEKSQGGSKWEMNYIQHTSQNAEVDVALTNSFGFGGTNASLCFLNTPRHGL